MNIARPFVIHLLPSSLASYVCSLSLCSSPCDKVGGCVGVWVWVWVCVCVGVLCVCVLSQVGLSDLFFEIKIKFFLLFLPACVCVLAYFVCVLKSSRTL